MATTCGALSLAMNSSTIASPQRSSSSVLSQPSGSLNWPQRLQSEDRVSENYNCKKEILRALFSTSSCSGSSGSSSSFRCGSTGISLLFPKMCKEKRVPLAQFGVQALAGKEPLRIMISGAPASGKGTQCELIVAKYGLTHISAGDLLRAEVAAGTDAGNKAQEYMQEGKLVPNEIVVMVPDEILVQRSVGRRYDPVTGKIYHLMYAPPETPEIAARLTQRLDDTEEKVDGNRPKAEVFAEIDKLLLELQEGETEEVGATIATRSL
ncbi:hypothetical protein BDL97_18G062700 [Sphagnum fallax]|nr:hypothetical protein BDL97_18G062700 [Sphagnum fallax]